MSKVTFFLLLFFVLTGTVSAKAQTFTTSLDTPVASFEIRNKKAVRVQPGTATGYAQRNAGDLVYMLDQFFHTVQYREAKSIKAKQYFVNADLSKEEVNIDSFRSAVFILDIPATTLNHKHLDADTFLTLQSRPTKVPENFYITRLDAKRLMLVAVLTPLYRDAAAAAERKKNTVAYLNWLQHKYR